MKGLLIKDFMLMKNNKPFFVMIILMGGMLSFVWDNPDFAVSYVSILFTMFTVSTITYDEYENGLAYLFSLPVTRKRYAAGKYIFGLIAGVGALVFMSAVTWITVTVKHTAYSVEEWIGVVSVSFLVIVVFLSLMIPMQIKFEADKSRIAMLILSGGVFLVVFGAVKIAVSLGINVEKIFDSVIQMYPEQMIIGSILSGIIFMLVSNLISVKILENKEF